MTRVILGGTPQICGVLGTPTIHVLLHFKQQFFESVEF